MGAAAVTFVRGRKVFVANAEMKISFLAPVPPGRRAHLRGRGRLGRGDGGLRGGEHLGPGCRRIRTAGSWPGPTPPTSSARGILTEPPASGYETGLTTPVCLHLTGQGTRMAGHMAPKHTEIRWWRRRAPSLGRRRVQAHRRLFQAGGPRPAQGPRSLPALGPDRIVRHRGGDPARAGRVLRLLQTETGTALTGDWSWVPYFAVALLGIGVAVVAGWRITAGPGGRSDPVRGNGRVS